ncbi:MAG: hypothetical protein MUF06_12055 [Pirellulaceae bacterium]|nr:hypothetical protein [Pirellulaceae bacterium]
MTAGRDAALAPSRALRLRFSLRSLLVLIALVAVGLGGFAFWRDAKVREQRAARKILDRGGSVGWVDGRPLAERPRWVQRLAWVLPEACLQTANWIDFPRDPTDADLALLADLPHIKTLHLVGAKKVTPAGLAHLGRLSHVEDAYFKETWLGPEGLAHISHWRGLRTLWLAETGVTEAQIPWIAANRGLTHLDLSGADIGDESLPAIAGLTDLEVLALRDTRVTPQGIESLSKLPKLAHLYLRGTRLDDAGLGQLAAIPTLQTLEIRRTNTTAEGRARFKAALPNCRVEED